jgi:RIO kinase 2
LTYPGYDYLAMKTFMKRNTLSGIGRQIGVGKESDIYLGLNAEQDDQLVVKFHRLGRTSFRTIKANRDYLKGRNSTNWLYCSRLSALKEYAFMRALYETGDIPTPKPLDQNRHCVCMEWIDGTVLNHVREMTDPVDAMQQCLELIVKLAEYGLIHGDFNEFNLMIRHADEKIIVIDFPQMVSTSHRNAEMYFDRDIECIHVFFEKRFSVTSEFWPSLDDIVKTKSIDVQLAASGFSKEQQEEFERIQEEIAREEGGGDIEDDIEPEIEQEPSADNYDISAAEKELLEESSDNDQQQQQVEDDVEEEVDEEETEKEEKKKKKKKKETLDTEDIKKKVRRNMKKKEARQQNVVKAAKRNAQKGKVKANRSVAGEFY